MAEMGPEERSFHTECDTAELLEQRGPWVYELFAVLIHSGSALGGHYYAYIRSFADGQVRGAPWAGRCLCPETT